MGSSKSHAFDPLDLEIIDLVYDVAWQQVSVRQPPRDEAEVEERQAFLRKRVFDLADSNGVDFDTLLDRVLASLPEPPRSHYVHRPRSRRPSFGDMTKRTFASISMTFASDPKWTFR